MKDNKEVNIDLVKGTLNDYIIKDSNNIFIGRFTIVEIDKDNKKCNVKLKFYRENKYDLLKKTIELILMAIFKDSNIYKINIIVNENINLKVFLDLGFVLEGIFSENLFVNGVFIDEISFGINRNEYQDINRNFMVKLKGPNIEVRNLTPDCAEELLNYYKKNEEHLRNFEPTRDNSFYTLEVQKGILLESYKQLMKGISFDLGIYKGKEMIGKIKISNIVNGVFKSAIIGYSIDRDYQGKGYMKETVRLILKYAKEELQLHRIEASVLTDNIRSKNVLLGNKFKELGINKQYLFINNQWRDHITFYKILDN
ncbi:GNAT family protein [Clostridium sp.]|uniref:GNAT family N-acetyltransferase n=1 Tax=Clostridium sp. TaxID=1506 RepID=UPI0026264BBC|nr:GNAT family protein [Clostridium sp.]